METYNNSAAAAATLFTTQCTQCNQTMVNSVTQGLVRTTIVFPLSDDEIVAVLNPALYFVHTYAYLLWYLIGIPANFIAFFVWLQRQMIHSSSCYMAALALTDNVFLLLHIVTNASKWSNSASALNYPVLCQMLPLLYVTVQYMSALLVLEFTVEQYIAICHPFQRGRYCRVSIARKAIAGVVLIAVAISSPQAYFFTLLSDAQGNTFCTVRMSLLKGGTASFWSIWTWTTEMLIFGAAPVTCLLLNLRVIYEVTRQSKVKLVRNYSRNGRTGPRRKPNRHASTTVMLLVVSLYWVCTEIPATIALGLKQAYPAPQIVNVDEAEDNKDIHSFMAYMTAKIVVEVISFSRYSCKLFFYLATGRQFRRHLLKLVFRCNKRLSLRWNDSTIRSRTSSFRQGAERTSLIIMANGQVPADGRAENNNNNSKPLCSIDNNRVSWDADPATEVFSLQDDM